MQCSSADLRRCVKRISGDDYFRLGANTGGFSSPNLELSIPSSANCAPKSDPSFSLVELLQSPLQDPFQMYPKYAENGTTAPAKSFKTSAGRGFSRIRKPLLYPSELRGQCDVNHHAMSVFYCRSHDEESVG